MFEDLKIWFRNDKYGIMLSLLCAFISIIPGIIKIFASTFDSKFFKANSDVWQPLCLLLITIIGLCVIVFIYKPEALNELSDKEALKDYIEEKCQIKQTVSNDSETAYKIVKATVRQFYAVWFTIWMLWTLFYGIALVQSLCSEKNLEASFMVIRYFLDFFSSMAVYTLYIILNDITVNISSRTDDRYSCLFKIIILGVIILSICVLFQILYLSSPVYKEFDIYTRLILGFFGAWSFVMVLGKLNSKRLHIHRILISFLYIYAISQAYSIFLYPYDNRCGNFQYLIDIAETILPWVTSLGKVVLLITLSWILYRNRLIFYIVHSSLMMTSGKTDIDEFNRYME